MAKARGEERLGVGDVITVADAQNALDGIEPERSDAV